MGTILVPVMLDTQAMEEMAPVQVMIIPAHVAVKWMTDGLLHSDVNECEDGIHNCHVNATCENNIGNFSCNCNNGFEGDGITCTSNYIIKVPKFLDITS